MNTHSELNRSLKLSSSIESALRLGRVAFLAAAAALPLTAAGYALAAPQVTPATLATKSDGFVKPCPTGYTCWWDQNSNGDGYGVDSQNFTSNSSYSIYDDMGADDFYATGLRTVTGVDATGQYYNGAGPATSFNVTFYANTSCNPSPNPVIHCPGTVLYSFTGMPYVNPTATSSFQITLCKWNANHTRCRPTKIRFKGNKKEPIEYWVSVVANCGFSTCGQWAWDTRPVYAGTQPAVWQGGTGWAPTCQTWDTLDICVGIPKDDFMFDLR